MDENRIRDLETNLKLMAQSLEHMSKTMDTISNSVAETAKYNSEVMLIKKELEHMNREIKESFEKDRDRNDERFERVWVEIRSQKSIINRIGWIVVTPIIAAVVAGIIKSS